jgi:hypothetical protein
MLLAHAVEHDVLRIWSRSATERAFQLARQLRCAVDALNASGIGVLCVKGPVLAVTAYGDPARRGVSGDLDLVVRPRDFAPAVACLRAVGYVRHEGSADPEHEHEQWQREAHLLPSALPGTMLELHTDLVGALDTASVNLDDVFARARRATVFGTELRVLSAEDELLYLCLHGARHFWRRLLWVCDVDAVVRSDRPLDWRSVLSRAAAIDATQPLALGLHLARTLFGTPLPALPSLAVRPRRLRWTAALVARRMADTSAGCEASFPVLLASEIAARETVAQRLTYLRRRLAPTPRDRAWVRLPRHLAWLRIVLRPLRLLTRFGNPYELRR